MTVFNTPARQAAIEALDYCARPEFSRDRRWSGASGRAPSRRSSRPGDADGWFPWSWAGRLFQDIQGDAEADQIFGATRMARRGEIEFRRYQLTIGGRPSVSFGTRGTSPRLPIELDRADASGFLDDVGARFAGEDRLVERGRLPDASLDPGSLPGSRSLAVVRASSTGARRAGEGQPPPLLTSLRRSLGRAVPSKWKAFVWTLARRAKIRALDAAAGSPRPHLPRPVSLPPARLRRRVALNASRAEFVAIGREAASQRRGGVRRGALPGERYPRWLDFGCGPGRVARHLLEHPGDRRALGRRRGSARPSSGRRGPAGPLRPDRAGPSDSFGRQSLRRRLRGFGLHAPLRREAGRLARPSSTGSCGPAGC